MDINCNICVNDYSKKNYKIECLSCNGSFCCRCLQNNIIISNKEECLHCRYKFSTQFLLDILPNRFKDTKYKEYKKNQYFEKEKFLFSETVYEINNMKKKQYYINKYNELLINRKNTNCIIQKSLYGVDMDLIKTIIENLDVYVTFNLEELKQFKNEYMEYREKLSKINLLIMETQDQNKNILMKLKNKELLKRKRNDFKKHCIYNECKGFLNNNNICIICNSKVCIQCNNLIKDDNHICNPDEINSYNIIIQNSKPCPKCNIHIEKEKDTCNDMYCTECNTKFNWATLKIIKNSNNYFHNPHHQELLHTDILPTKILIKLESIGDLSILRLNRLYFYLIQEILPKYVNINDTKNIRMKFLTNQIDEKKYKKELFRNNKIQNKKDDFYNIFNNNLKKIKTIIEKFVVEYDLVQNESLILLLHSTNNDIKNLIKTINIEFLTLKNRYNNKSYVLQDNLLLV